MYRCYLYSFEQLERHATTGPTVLNTNVKHATLEREQLDKSTLFIHCFHCYFEL
jgi:hypothetical protein